MFIPSSTQRSVWFCAAIWPFLLSAAQANNPPQDLADRFELPPGFHIFRAAGPELSGGSYALTFDGEGRLLVGDGNAVRRLIDKDEDGVFDSYEVIATGLGWRGPQGLLVYDDKLYAVGGDGIQVFEGYRSGKELVHKGRIGNKLNTGGDHDAHTIFRGHDGYIYFMAGNGAGVEDRKHITEESSPVMFEREASVFRISPDGAKWECLAAGGRNPPNLGMNYLGELFSFDSDMEWHVGLPWYRPVRLNHWAIGGDQGWQEVGAYPPYYIDCLPGILDVGRGSPNWGMFYEHNQFPEKYRDAYIVCDYRWKRESNDQYATTGRLVVFFLKRDGADWKASMETLARPRPGARDADGKPINFALVDVAVAPDGSLFMTDHNQGIWRISYGPTTVRPVRLMDQTPSMLSKTAKQPLDDLLTLPQPASEWSRRREVTLRDRLGKEADRSLQKAALDRKRPMPQRLRAIRLAALDFGTLPDDFMKRLAGDASAEIRGQAAWLIGNRMRQDEMPLVLKMLSDTDPFVRRRAAEALTRFHSPTVIPALIERLGDSERIVRYVAMSALAHYPTGTWIDRALRHPAAQVRMRALVAGVIRRQPPTPGQITSVLAPLAGIGTTTKAKQLSREDLLDALRLCTLFHDSFSDEQRRVLARSLVSADFPHRDKTVRWEQIRVIGAYRAGLLPDLVKLLLSEPDPVSQFHIAQAIARLPNPLTDPEYAQIRNLSVWDPEPYRAAETATLDWLLSTQSGWFAQFDGKGVEFPLFWSTVLAEFARHHRDALLRDLSKVNFVSLLGGVVIDLVAESPNATDRLIALYRDNDNVEARIKVVTALRKVPGVEAGAFLREQFAKQDNSRLKGAILQSLAVQPDNPTDLLVFREGLLHPDVDVVKVCASAVVRHKPDLDAALANRLLSRMAERRSLFYAVDHALVVLSGLSRPGHKPEPVPGERLEESTRNAAITFWKEWYEQRFRKKFESSLSVAGRERSDDELHAMVLGADLGAGDPARGAKVYEQLQCNSCHGGGVTPGQEGRLFGPDLAGVTRRLSRQELADAIVYPSKQVAERFQARVVQLKDGEPITGFITEQTEDSLTLAAREEVHRIPRSRIRAIEPQAASLMPERLLNPLGDDEIRDLLVFLDRGMGSTGATEKGTKR